jgi:hypothetical protein
MRGQEVQMKMFWTVMIIGGFLLWIGNAVSHLATMF